MLKVILTQIQFSRDYTSSSLLISLFRALRPRRAFDTEEAVSKLEHLTLLLRVYPEFQQSLYQYILTLFEYLDPLRFYTDLGIVSRKEFWTEVGDRLSYKVLPPLSPDKELSTLFEQLFLRKSDYQWVKDIPVQTIEDFLDALQLFNTSYISP